MAAPIRSETTLVRPYAKIDAADAPLDCVRVLVNGAEHAPGAIVLPSEEITGSKISIRLPTSKELLDAVDSTVVPTIDCGLVVLASGKSHRASRVIVQSYLKTDDWPQLLELPRQPDDIVLNDRFGFTLTVAVVLLHDLTAEPLRPHMAGTWLARREFTISPEREDTSFSPEALTEEIRAHHQLPAGVLQYVEVGYWQDADLLSDEVRVYMDPEVLSLLLANPSDGSSVQMQIELAVLATEVVAVTIARELSTSGAATESLLGPYAAAARFFANVARTTDLSVDDVLHFAANEPARLRAHLEASFGANAATVRALKEK